MPPLLPPKRIHGGDPSFPAPSPASCGPLQGSPWPTSSQGSFWDSSGQGRAPLEGHAGHWAHVVHSLPRCFSGLDSFKKISCIYFWLCWSSLLHRLSSGRRAGAPGCTSFGSRGSWALEQRLAGLAALRFVGSSRIRGRTRVSCIAG